MRPTPVVRPWLFGVASIPYGAFNGLVAVALPYVLRQRGLPVERIAAISALVQLPAIWYFLWAPIVDIRLRRRTWLILLSVASAACASAAIGSDAAAAVRPLTLLLVAASVFNQPVSSALGGLAAAVVPNESRGRTGGWSQAGILGGGILAGGTTVWLTAHAPLRVTAVVAGLFIAVPAFSVLSIDEPTPSQFALSAQLVRMYRDIAATLSRREVWIGFVFFLSPIGAGALMNLFTALAPDFHATAGAVLLVVGVAGVVTPVGALVGGMACDRFDRWRVYSVAGLCAAAITGIMLIVPLAPATYVAGAAGYAFATGLSYAAFMALALQLGGSASAASGTRFTLFMAAVNVPVVYMLRLDGIGHAHFGARGMLATDAIANAAFGLLFFFGASRVAARLLR